MKTFMVKPKTVSNNWYIIDASGKTLGRLASKIAHRLLGKHKIIYTPHIDTGDFIIVLNAEKISFSGKKDRKKIYYKHTGYVGNLKKTTLGEMINNHPERVIEFAIKGMLPKGPLGREMFRKLKVFSGNVHNHIAQKPVILDI